MKLLTCFVLLLMFAFNSVSFGEERNDIWGKESNGVQISIASKLKTISQGDALEIIFKVKNVSVNEQLLPGRAPILQYKFKVINPHGKDTPATAFGSERLEVAAVGARTSGTPIRPNETLNFSALINRLFDFSIPGEYLISVSTYSGKDEVVSNQIAIKIAEIEGDIIKTLDAEKVNK